MLPHASKNNKITRQQETLERLSRLVYDNDNIYFYEYLFFPLSPTRKLAMSKMVGVLQETGTAYPPEAPHFTCVL